ncbi:MAG: hypothetical protein AAFO91_11715, partial [Bacteroidota bacterium]
KKPKETLRRSIAPPGSSGLGYNYHTNDTDHATQYKIRVEKVHTKLTTCRKTGNESDHLVIYRYEVYKYTHSKNSQ